MTAGTGPPGSPGGVPPLNFRCHCVTCDVMWTGGRECWICGRTYTPMTVLQVVGRIG